MSMIKRILIAAVIIIVVLQFIRPARNSDDLVPGKGISSVVTVPDSVSRILANACFDCHSNKTRYPWYSNVQPVGWFLNKHIKDGKQDLNFSDFAGYTQRRQVNKLSLISELVSKDEMPLKSYKLIHKDARLNSNQKDLLINWAEKSQEILRARE